MCNLSEIVYIVEETGWPTGQGVLAATCTTVFIVGHLNKQFINDTIYFFFLFLKPVSVPLKSCCRFCRRMLSNQQCKMVILKISKTFESRGKGIDFPGI